MKPRHRPPIIRKTIKWGGAVLTVVLAALAAWSYVERTRIHRPYVLLGGWSVQFFPSYVYIWTPWEPKEGLPPPIQYRWPTDSMPFRPYVRHYYASQWWCSIPLWMQLTATAIPTMIAWRLDTLARRRARLNLCPNCTYDRTGLAADAKCPECGTMPAGYAARP